MTRPWLWSVYFSLPAHLTLIKWFWLYFFHHGTNYYLTTVWPKPLLTFLWMIVIAPWHFLLFNLLSRCVPGKRWWLFLTFLRSFTHLPTGCFTQPKVLQDPAASAGPFPIHQTAHGRLASHPPLTIFSSTVYPPLHSLGMPQPSACIASFWNILTPVSLLTHFLTSFRAVFRFLCIDPAVPDLLDASCVSTFHSDPHALSPNQETWNNCLLT